MPSTSYLKLSGKTAIISDIHLSSEKSKTFQLLKKYFKYLLSQNFKHLILLGDIFEYWIGDDVETPISKAFSNLAQELRDNNIQIYFMPGNRDFLLNQNYLNQFNGEYLQDPCLLKMDSIQSPIMLSHGDQYSKSEINYQIFRFFFQSKLFKFIFLKKSKSKRKAFAEKLRKQSKKTHKNKQNKIYPDLTSKSWQKAFLKLLIKNKINNINNLNNLIFIHGHTHRPNIEKQDKFTRYTLGDWHPEFAHIIEIENSAIQLKKII